MNCELMSDKPREECGVFGIYSRHDDVALNTYWGLYALQHRGQESAGITLTDGCEMDIQRGMGLVGEVFRKGLPEMEGAYIAIGHVRYSTTGSSLLINTQPLMVTYSGGHISLAHNGNLTNARELRADLEQKGSVFQTSIDSEVIVNLIARSGKNTIEERVLESVARIEGAYCLVIMTDDKLIGVRDPHGFRPLCIGKLNGGWVLASESCALDSVGAEMIRDLAPGEMVVIDDAGPRYYGFGEEKRRALCIFEYIYFARPDSIIDGQSVYAARFAMGRQLARESGFKADLVISVPDSGTTAALGFSYESGVPFAEGLIKNRYIGRTFIQPEQQKRDTGAPPVLRGLDRPRHDERQDRQDAEGGWRDVGHDVRQLAADRLSLLLRHRYIGPQGTDRRQQADRGDQGIHRRRRALLSLAGGIVRVGGQH